MNHPTEGEKMLDVEPAHEESMQHDDVRATALLDQLSAIDSRYSGLEDWRPWKVPLSSVLVAVAMGMLGLSYRNPVALLIYASIVVVPLIDFVLRHRMRRSWDREREVALEQHDEIVRQTPPPVARNIILSHTPPDGENRHGAGGDDGEGRTPG